MRTRLAPLFVYRKQRWPLAARDQRGSPGRQFGRLANLSSELVFIVFGPSDGVSLSQSSLFA